MLYIFTGDYETVVGEDELLARVIRNLILEGYIVEETGRVGNMAFFRTKRA